MSRTRYFKSIKLFDENGKVTLEIECDKDCAIRKITSYYYNDNKNLFMKSIVAADGIMLSQCLTNYDNHNKIIGITE